LPAAYTLGRKDFVGRNFFTAIFVLTVFFEGGLIPTYLVVKNLGMIDTIWALVLPNAAAIWNIVIARVFFQSTIPQELEESAKIASCSNFRLFFKIFLPLSSTLTAVLALLYEVDQWNNYFDALLYLKDRSLYPFQMVLREILVCKK